MEKKHGAVNEAALVKEICVLSGELLECFQWQEDTYDANEFLSLIGAMKDRLAALEELASDK